MLKEWTVRIVFVIAFAALLLNDVLNWSFVKKALQQQLENQGVVVEKIEKITTSSLHLTGLRVQDQTIDTLVLHFNPLHLLANGIKRLLHRSDFRQDLTLLQFDGTLNGLPFSLTRHLSCSIMPSKILLNPIHFRIGTEEVVIHCNKILPAFGDLKNSVIDFRGSWKGPLKQLYTLINSDFKLIQGDVAVEWKLSGTAKAPVMSTQASLSKGTFEAPAIGLFLKDLHATIEGKDLLWTIKDLQAQDTEKTAGQVWGSGWLDFSTHSAAENANFEYQLNLDLKNVAVLAMDSLKGRSSGDLQLIGDRSGLLLKGKGLVHTLKLVVDNVASGKKAPLPILFTDETPEDPGATYPVLFDIDLELEKSGVVKGENLHSQWIGKAHLGGSTQELSLLGKLKLESGEYRLNSKNIEIKEGRIHFNGDIFKDTTVFALATIELKDLIAEIIVRGHLDTLNLTLRSNPPLPQREILSWILFNQGARHITALEGDQLNRSLSEFTKGGNRKNMLSDIQGKLGIDSIDFDRRTLGDEEEVSLKLGKYFSKNFFVGVSKGINSEVNRIGFEASLNQHWKVQGEIGDNAEGQLHLKWKNDY